MPKVLISDSLNNLAREIFIKNNIEVDVNTDLSISELINIIKNYEGLVVRSATKVTKEIIEAGNKLKIIGRAGAGVDNINVEFAKKNNIIVMNTPGGNTNATAEHTFMLILSLYRNITEANKGTHKGLWEKKKFKGFELKGKKIGLIGFGNVASRVSDIAKGFDMEIVVLSKSFENRKKYFPNIKSVSLEELITTSDIISLHCKSASNNEPIINSKELNKMKNNSIIINTARGNLINERDLKEALENLTIYGAAIDVYSEEPANNNILFGTKNIILTPHIAASTVEAQINVSIQIAEQITNYFSTGKIINAV
jgi:D-3-phosphoglycerate dehydrogenase